MFFLLVFCFLLVILVEVPVLVAAGQWRELRAFGVLLALGLALSLAVMMRWPVPNPTKIVAKIFNPVADFLGIK